MNRLLLTYLPPARLLRYVMAACLVAPMGLPVGLTARAQEASPARSEKPFGIQVVDAETGRGVPLIELRTTNQICLVTDNAGWVAFDEPGLVGQKVFFSVEGHGYEFAPDGFGIRGKALEVQPGKTAKLQVQRVNLAERLYRMTGQGQYHHSTRLGLPATVEHPNLNAQVMGQDSTQAVVLGERILWTWGDTARTSYPLGNFATSGAWSLLPQHGGPDPAVSIGQQYVVDESGFSRPMYNKPPGGTVIWMHGLFTLENPQGQVQAVTHYSLREGLGKEHEHGIAVFDEQKELFEPVRQFDPAVRLYPRGQTFRHTDGEIEYIYFATPYPLVRVPARWEAVFDPAQYEAWTCLEEGADFDAENPRLARNEQGKLVYAWRKETAVVDAERQRQLQEKGHLRPDEGWIQTKEVDGDRRVVLHRGSVRWNEYLDAWVMIANEIYGEASNLGEVYFLTSKEIPGRWSRAKKIVTHNQYSFYNPVHHEFFDQNQGQAIYFDGTYTRQFSRTDSPTPRYDYNTIMYRLDLTDPRLKSVIGER